jgi:hypothetical protein
MPVLNNLLHIVHRGPGADPASSACSFSPPAQVHGAPAEILTTAFGALRSVSGTPSVSRKIKASVPDRSLDVRG